MNYKVKAELANGKQYYNVMAEIAPNCWEVKKVFRTKDAAQEYIQELNAYGEKNERQ